MYAFKYPIFFQENKKTNLNLLNFKIGVKNRSYIILKRPDDVKVHRQRAMRRRKANNRYKEIEKSFKEMSTENS
jgi:hypothetical protein